MKKIKITTEEPISPDAEKMFEDYWRFEDSTDYNKAFALSDQAFLSKYSNQYCYQELLSITFYAVFDVGECDICLRPFKVIINSRNHCYSYRKKKKKICRICENYRVSIKDLDGKIA
jgi:hypothetical protein